MPGLRRACAQPLPRPLRTLAHTGTWPVAAKTPPPPPLKFRDRRRHRGSRNNAGRPAWLQAHLHPWNGPRLHMHSHSAHAAELAFSMAPPQGKKLPEAECPGWRAMFPVRSLPCLKETGWAMGLLGPSQSYLPLLLHRTGAGHPQLNGAHGHGPPPSSLRPLYVRAGRE